MRIRGLWAVVVFWLLGCPPVAADVWAWWPAEPDTPQDQACLGNPGDWHFCGERCLCGEGEGDCDSDEDCGAGLYCTSSMGAHFGWIREVDVCLPRCPSVGVGGWAFCSEECPCYEGEGDCDGDEQCMRGLVCVRNLGSLFFWHEEVDVCLAPPDRSMEQAPERAVATWRTDPDIPAVWRRITD